LAASGGRSQVDAGVTHRTGTHCSLHRPPSNQHVGRY
jgi:hypothetical protein